MVDTQKSCRGLSHQKATDLVLGYFLESWAKISLVTFKENVDDENEDLKFGKENPAFPKSPENTLLSDTAVFWEYPVHFDNIEKKTCIDVLGQSNAPAEPFDREVDFCGLKFFYGLKALTKSNNDMPPVSSELVIRHAGSFQDTLGGRGNRSFVRNGVLAIKLRTNIQKGLTELYKCANIIAECFEGRQTNSSLWFQSVEINEGGVDGTSYQSEVIIAFQYDQVK